MCTVTTTTTTTSTTTTTATTTVKKKCRTVPVMPIFFEVPRGKVA